MENHRPPLRLPWAKPVHQPTVCLLSRCPVPLPFPFRLINISPASSRKYVVKLVQHRAPLGRGGFLKLKSGLIWKMCLQTVEQENCFLSKAGSASSAGWRRWEEGSGRSLRDWNSPPEGMSKTLAFIFIFYFILLFFLNWYACREETEVPTGGFSSLNND